MDTGILRGTPTVWLQLLETLDLQHRMKPFPHNPSFSLYTRDRSASLSAGSPCLLLHPVSFSFTLYFSFTGIVEAKRYVYPEPVSMTIWGKKIVFADVIKYVDIILDLGSPLNSMTVY